MNKRRWLLALAAFLPGLCVLAQAPAEVLSYSGSYEMKSPTEARYEVHLQVLVKDANGIGAATFSEFTDEFKGNLSLSFAARRQVKCSKSHQEGHGHQEDAFHIVLLKSRTQKLKNLRLFHKIH